MSLRLTDACGVQGTLKRKGWKGYRGRQAGRGLQNASFGQDAVSLGGHDLALWCLHCVCTEMDWRRGSEVPTPSYSTVCHSWTQGEAISLAVSQLMTLYGSNG